MKIKSRAIMTNAGHIYTGISHHAAKVAAHEAGEIPSHCINNYGYIDADTNEFVCIKDVASGDLKSFNES